MPHTLRLVLLLLFALVLLSACGSKGALVMPDKQPQAQPQQTPPPPATDAKPTDSPR